MATAQDEEAYEQLGGGAAAAVARAEGSYTHRLGSLQSRVDALTEENEMLHRTILELVAPARRGQDDSLAPGLLRGVHAAYARSPSVTGSAADVPYGPNYLGRQTESDRDASRRYDVLDRSRYEVAAGSGGGHRIYSM